MPVSYIKHGDWTFDDEKVEEIAKNCLLVNQKKAVLGRFFSPTAEINGDQIIKRRQVLIDPTSIASLNEGETPREDQIKVVTFSEKVRSCGSFIGFTRHAKKRNRDSILEQCRVQLAHNRLYDMEAIRFIAMNSTSYSVALVTSPSVSFWTTFTNARITLQKNKGKGPYVFLCPPEIEAAIMAEAKAANSLIQSTPEGVKLFGDGYIGKYAGFEIVSVAEPYMYSGSNYLAYFIAKTENGAWPLVDTKLGEGNVEVIVHDIGDGGYQDPTNENGTIASRIDYVGAFLEHPECVLALSGATTSNIGAVVAGNLPGAYEIAPHDASGVGGGRDNAGVQKVVVGGPIGVMFTAIKKADGTSLDASATVTLKTGKTQGSGTTVTDADSDGVYIVEAGKWYNYSIAVTGYKVDEDGASASDPATGTFVADPQHPLIKGVFVANS